jgi:hypothetical protein
MKEYVCGGLYKGDRNIVFGDNSECYCWSYNKNELIRKSILERKNMGTIAVGRESEKLVVEIIDAFGLKNCTKLDIHFKRNSVFTITAECNVENDQLKKVVSVMKKFQLGPIVELERTDCIGDQIATFQVK